MQKGKFISFKIKFPMDSFLRSSQIMPKLFCIPRHRKSDGRILSAYLTEKGAKLYVITEADSSATTIMLAEEY